MMTEKQKDAQRIATMVGKTKSLWDAGYTSSEIAKHLNEPLRDVHEYIGIIESARRNESRAK